MESFFNSIKALIHGIEFYHDSFTMRHEYNVERLMKIFFQHLNFDKSRCEKIAAVSCLHDFGKLAISKKILEKPGKLSGIERKTIETHPIIGCELVKKIKHPLAELAQVIILNHHEAFDGSGYPHQLKGKNIPIEARICSICDVYDAMREYRPYRQGSYKHEFIVNIILSKEPGGMAAKFDPELLEIFSTIHEQFDQVYSESH